MSSSNINEDISSPVTTTTYTYEKGPEREKHPNTCCPSKKVCNSYVNPWKSYKKSPTSFIYNMKCYIRSVTRKSFLKQPPEKYVSVDVDLPAINAYAKAASTVQSNQDPALPPVQLTWFGHAAFLLQMNRFNILFDPFLSNRASPVSFAGPYRYRPRGFDSFSQLPAIDAIVISHNHYDHLDKKTIKEILREEKNRNVHIFCPMNLKKWFIKRRIPSSHIIECDWWDDYTFTKNIEVKTESSTTPKTISSSLTISCVPAQHFSQRTLFDENKSLWSGWVMKSDDLNFYFAGDTGYRSIPPNCHNVNKIKKYPYNPVFKQIGNIHGPFDLACIPIGPANNDYSMTPLHVNPRDSINLHLDVRSRHSVAMHWGTVANLGTIDIASDPKDLRKEMIRRKIPLSTFHDVYIGQLVSLTRDEIQSVREQEKLTATAGPVAISSSNDTLAAEQTKVKAEVPTVPVLLVKEEEEAYTSLDVSSSSEDEDEDGEQSEDTIGNSAEKLGSSPVPSSIQPSSSLHLPITPVPTPSTLRSPSPGEISQVSISMEERRHQEEINVIVMDDKMNPLEKGKIMTSSSQTIYKPKAVKGSCISALKKNKSITVSPPSDEDSIQEIKKANQQKHHHHSQPQETF